MRRSYWLPSSREGGSTRSDEGCDWTVWVKRVMCAFGTTDASLALIILEHCILA